MMQLLVLPYLRGPLHIRRRDLVLTASDSLTLRVTVVESDDPSAQALELSGGIGGPMVHMRVWSHDSHRSWDYGWCPIPGFTRLFWSADGIVSDAIGSFDIFIPAGVMAGWPRRCGWSIQLNFDDSGDSGVTVPPGSPILVGGFEQSEMLATGSLHVRWAGNRPSVSVPLFTDDSLPVLTDGTIITGDPGLSVTEGVAMLSWPSAAGAVVANGTYELALAWPWQSGAITGVTADTANGSFTASVQVNGSPVAGVDAVSITSHVPVTTLAGINTITVGDNLTLVISGATGSPTDATVQVNYTRSAT